MIKIAQTSLKVGSKDFDLYNIRIHIIILLNVQKILFASAISKYYLSNINLLLNKSINLVLINILQYFVFSFF